MIRLRASVRAALLSSVFCLLLSGCGGHRADTAAPPPDTAPPPPGAEAIKPIEGASTASTTTGDMKAEAEKPVEEVKPIPTPMETFRALAPEGVKVTQLFAEPEKDPDKRMARMEKAVQELRNDFDTVMPAMVRMVAMENNLRDLVEQLKTINGNHQSGNAEGASTATGTAPAEVPAPAATPTDQAVAAPAADAAKGTETPPTAATADDKTQAAPAAAATAPTPPSAAPEASAASAAPPAYTAPTLGKVSSVRVGDHLDMTRIVIDMSAKTAYTAELNKDGTKLIISTPQMAWDAAASATMPKSKLIASYKYENGVMVVDLRQPAEIKARSLLGPAKGEASYRLMVDVAPRPAAGG